MSWTLQTPPKSDGTLGVLPLPDHGVAHIVVTSGDTAPILVQELQQVHTELGRISQYTQYCAASCCICSLVLTLSAIGSWGAKLESASCLLTIIPSHDPAPAASNDPRTTGYGLQPRADERSEAIFLRHGDLISSSDPYISLTCRFAPEVQVTSSAADQVIGEPIEPTDGVAETPEEETEDEDPDTTITTVKATQGKSQQQPQATPQLSAQRSVVVQETPTVARVNSADNLPSALEGDGELKLNQSEPVENTPVASPEPTNHIDAEPFSTARTGQSHEVENVKKTDDGKSSLITQRKPSVDLSSHTVDAISGNTSLIRRHPEVRISKKRPTTAADEDGSEAAPVGRVGKRARRTSPIIPSEDTQDSREETIAVDASRVRKKKTSEEPPAPKSRKKRVDEVKDFKEVAEASPPRSQRGSQRSNTATSEPYDGDAPRVAISNSSLTETSQAVKFLKKQGGAFVESVKEDFNVLWQAPTYPLLSNKF